jgi:translation initiation factor IF-3
MAHVEMEPKLVGKSIGMTLSPLPVAKRKRRFLPLEAHEMVEEDEDDKDDGEDE